MGNAILKKRNAEFVRVHDIILPGKGGQRESNSKLKWNFKGGFN